MSRLKTLIEAFNKLPEYNIEIGVVAADASREKDPKEDKYLSNAEILFIQENGSPLHHIPPRPVLNMTIQWATKELLNPTIKRAVKAYMHSKFDQKALERELEVMGGRMVKYAQDIIYSNDGRLAPNAPSTIAKKGDNHPLFDTGQLARSITYQLTKK